MTSIEGMPHLSIEPYVTSVLVLARRISYPAVDRAGETVAAGEASWGAWTARATRAQLVQTPGILTARVHREGKA